MRHDAASPAGANRTAEQQDSAHIFLELRLNYTVCTVTSKEQQVQTNSHRAASCLSLFWVWVGVFWAL